MMEENKQSAPQVEETKQPSVDEGTIMGMTPEEYSAKLRKTTQATLDCNKAEIVYCEKILEDLKSSQYSEYVLPVVMHNFILVAPRYRFALLNDIEMLLRADRRAAFKETVRFKDGAAERMKQINEVLNMLIENKKEDTEPDVAAFDISQFLVSHFCAVVQLGIDPTPATRKIYQDIRSHMIEHTQRTIKDKYATIARCEDILAKKLAGE